MLSITLRICYDPTFLFDKYSEYMRQKHSQELLNRIDDDKKVKDLLDRKSVVRERVSTFV